MKVPKGKNVEVINETVTASGTTTEKLTVESVSLVVSVFVAAISGTKAT